MSKRTYNSVYYVLDKNVHTCTRPCMCGVDTVLQLLAGISYKGNGAAAVPMSERRKH